MAKIFSREDGDLSTSIRIVKDRVYSDIDLSFFARTSTDGDIYRKVDAAAVKQAIKTLLLTNNFEKPYRPRFGANLGGLLFDLMDQETGNEIIAAIKNAVARWEPRIKLLNLKVTATPDFNLVDVTVEFRVIKTEEVVALRIPLDERSNRDRSFVLPVTPPPPAQLSNLTNLLFTDLNPSTDVIYYITLGIDGSVYLKTEVGPEVLNGSILAAPDNDQILTEDGLILVVQNYPSDSKFEP